MKKIVRLTESDLVTLINQVIEQEYNPIYEASYGPGPDETGASEPDPTLLAQISNKNIPGAADTQNVAEEEEDEENIHKPSRLSRRRVRRRNF